MELQEFTHQLRQELRGFDKYWRESTRESPEDFPNRLGFEEWLDQFNTWAGSNG